MTLPFFEKISIQSVGIPAFCIGSSSRQQESTEYSFLTNKILIPSSANLQKLFYISIENIFLTTGNENSPRPFVSLIIAISNDVCQKDTFQTLPGLLDSNTIIAKTILNTNRAHTIPNSVMPFYQTKRSIDQFFVPIVQDMNEYQQKTITLHCYGQEYDPITQKASYNNIDRNIERFSCTVIVCDSDYLQNSSDLF